MAKTKKISGWLNKYQSGTTSVEANGPLNFNMFNDPEGINTTYLGPTLEQVVDIQKAKMNYNNYHGENERPLTSYEIAIANQKNNPFYVTHNIGVRKDLSPEEFQYRAITNPASLGAYTDNPNPSQQQMMQSINNTPFGMFIENPYDNMSVDAGYRNNVIWADSNLDQKNSAGTWINLLGEGSIEHPEMYNSPSGRMFSSLYFIDPKLNKSNITRGDIFLSDAEKLRKESIYPYEKGAIDQARAENELGKKYKDKGIVAQNMFDSLYRVFGNAGVDLKGAVDFTPEMLDYITTNNLSDDDAKKYLLKQAGVNVNDKKEMDKILIHLNNFPIKEYINQNYKRPDVTQPTEKKKLGGKLKTYQSGTNDAEVWDQRPGAPLKTDNMFNPPPSDLAYFGNEDNNEIMRRKLNAFNQHNEDQTPLTDYEIALAAQRNTPFYLTHNVTTRPNLSPEEFKQRAITNPASLGYYVNNPSVTKTELSNAVKDTPFGQFVENLYSDPSSLDQGYFRNNYWANSAVMDPVTERYKNGEMMPIEDSGFMGMLTNPYKENFYSPGQPSLYFIDPHLNQSNQAPSGSFGEARNIYNNKIPGDAPVDNFRDMAAGEYLAKKGYVAEPAIEGSTTYRLFTNKGVDLKGAVDTTPEMTDYILKNNLGEEEIKKYLMQQAGIDTSKMTKEEIDRVLMHFNNNSVQSYINQNFPRPSVTNPTEKKKNGGWLNKYK